jgi:ABC-type Fe3+-siderophore transport system permease subunit
VGGVRVLSRRRFWAATGICALFLLVMLITMPLIGSSRIDFGGVLEGRSPDREIFVHARLSRVLLAALAGGALALAGVVFQALLRDALATPFTLGVSSGASLGAVVAICLGWQTVAGLPALWVFAFLGAAGTMLLVMWIAAEERRMSTFTLLLAGVAINSMCMAAVLFLHYLASFGQSFAIVRWLMGGVDAVEYRTLAIVAAAVLPAVVVAIVQSKDLNLLAVGEQWAATRGVAVTRTMVVAYLVGSFLTGVVTAMTGPIGFVGLIVPHGLRLVVGADHRVLVPCSFCVGAGFLAACDTLARTMLAPAEVPVGVVTALVGGPCFIWLLRRRRPALWS